jgi:hypothetical protein
LILLFNIYSAFSDADVVKLGPAFGDGSSTPPFDEQIELLDCSQENCPYGICVDTDNDGEYDSCVEVIVDNFLGS